MRNNRPRNARTTIRKINISTFSRPYRFLQGIRIDIGPGPAYGEVDVLSHADRAIPRASVLLPCATDYPSPLLRRKIRKKHYPFLVTDRPSVHPRRPWLMPGWRGLMKCARCEGLMVAVWMSDLHGSDVITGWRCLLCGENIDPGIAANRIKHSPPSRSRPRLPGPVRVGHGRMKSP